MFSICRPMILELYNHRFKYDWCGRVNNELRETSIRRFTDYQRGTRQAHHNDRPIPWSRLFLYYSFIFTA